MLLWDVCPTILHVSRDHLDSQDHVLIVVQNYSIKNMILSGRRIMADSALKNMILVNFTVAGLEKVLQMVFARLVLPAVQFAGVMVPVVLEVGANFAALGRVNIGGPGA